jgi:pyruvate formate lyase activating enzyme
MASIGVDGKAVEVPEGYSVREALETIGFEITMFLSDEGLFMPCQTGGCWSCAVNIDGELRPACVSKVHEGMRITMNTSSSRRQNK